MYPLVFVLGFGLIWRDSAAVRYGFILGSVGSLVAAYHTVLQFNVATSLPCPAIGGSCAERFMFEYGYITIPMMSLTAFALVLVFLATAYIYDQPRANDRFSTR